MRLFKRNYSKKRTSLILTTVMIVSIVACSLFILYELSDISSFKASQMKSCLQSLDCSSDQDCHDKAVKFCGASKSFRPY